MSYKRYILCIFWKLTFICINCIIRWRLFEGEIRKQSYLSSSGVKFIDEIVVIAIAWTRNIHFRIMIKVNFTVSESDIIVISTNKSKWIGSRWFVNNLDVIIGVSTYYNVSLIIYLYCWIRKVIESIYQGEYFRSFTELIKMSTVVMWFYQIFMIFWYMEMISTRNCLNKRKLWG